MMRFLLTVFLLLPVAAIASPQTFVESAAYALGDNDSQADGRRICALQAKEKILDRAGSLITSQLSLAKTETGGRFSESAQKDMRSFAAGIIQGETVADKIEIMNGRLVESCTVRATIDPDEIKRRLDQIARQPVPQQSISAPKPPAISAFEELGHRVDTIERGMLRSDVLAIAGQPRAIQQGGFPGTELWNYGPARVKLYQGIVDCVGKPGVIC